MSRHPLRRAHLIAPFGVGSLPVFPDGASMIVAGLDHWYAKTKSSQLIDLQDFRVEEWRLEKRLGVDHFRLPPDHRESWNKHAEDDAANRDLTIPALRFPRYHACSWCNRLDRRPMTEKGRLTCRYCEQQGKKWVPIAQVQFVAMCSAGHLDDFPFREWVHRSARRSCELPMKLTGSGGSLVSVRVRCDCGKSRHLSGVTQGVGEDGASSFLSTMLDPDGPDYRCGGRRPWLGEDHDEPCGEPLVGGLRSASNTYFAESVRSIYIPPSTATSLDDELLTKLGSPRVETLVRALATSGGQVTPGFLRAQFSGLFSKWDDETLEAAIAATSNEQAGDLDAGATTAVEGEVDYRKAEFDVLGRDVSTDQLVVKVKKGSDYSAAVSGLLESVSLVEKLRVTTAFTGFTRVRADEAALRKRSDHLWADPPPHHERWLPASIVYGEGMLLVLDRDLLRSWTSGRSVIARAGSIDRAYEESRKRGRPERDVTPAFVATHTLSHLLINQLAFESGYSSASLGERLYVGPDHAAVLIYTASGDSDGTLGGLVRLGRPGHLERIVQAALDRATWCSSDPICMELGAAGGQGPDSCNLAACHSCAILPETSCEEFNRFLDRGLLVGDHEGSLPGLVEPALTA